MASYLEVVEVGEYEADEALHFARLEVFFGFLVREVGHDDWLLVMRPEWNIYEL
jgi:hypothetical protein